ncbi:hypothetical protein KQI63_11370 [bacterium]|nr:hypothetical protein [bacterium]
MNQDTAQDHSKEDRSKTPDYMLAPTLLPYLESAWQNSQHFDSSRMNLYRGYFALASVVLLVHAFSGAAATNHLALGALTLFAVLCGLVTITISVRYKERIIRDIRVIYRINELLLNDPEEMKAVKNVFQSYRKPHAQEERRIRARLSTTQLFIFVVALVSTGLLIVSMATLFASSPEVLFGGAILSLGVHVVVYLLSKRGVTFNI